MELTDEQLTEIKEALDYMRDVGPADSTFAKILDGHDYIVRLSGDDGMGFWWHFNELLKVLHPDRAIETSPIINWQLVKVTLHKNAVLECAAYALGVLTTDMDTRFGIQEVDGENSIYAVQVRQRENVDVPGVQSNAT